MSTTAEQTGSHAGQSDAPRSSAEYVESLRRELAQARERAEASEREAMKLKGFERLIHWLAGGASGRRRKRDSL